MAVTSLEFADKERYLSQIEKLVHSQTLRKSESLCKLLRYLAEQAMIHPGGAGPKEYQIATEVFGRPPDFDPQADSAIRVQAGRLRLKLLEYYRNEGAADPIIVEIPNGSYALTFHPREPLIAVPAAPVTVTQRFIDRRAPRKSVRGWAIAVALLSLGLVAALAAVVSLAASLNSARSQKNTGVAPSAALHAFWNKFTAGPDAPWVIFSNAAFVGRPETGMRYLDPAHDSRDLILDHYTGVGEVLAVHELDEVFRLLDHPIRVKRGSLFSLDDAKDNDLIFVGSPAENLSLLDLPGTQEFVFKRFDSPLHKEDLGIVNTHPDAGEPAVFYPSDATRPLVEDYAIVALLRGLNPERRVLILGGTTTIGTQAAVEYVCGKDSLEELVRRLNALSSGDGKPFEALLRVKVTRGVPVGTELVALRKRK